MQASRQAGRRDTRRKSSGLRAKGHAVGGEQVRAGRHGTKSMLARPPCCLFNQAEEQISCLKSELVSEWRALARDQMGARAGSKVQLGPARAGGRANGQVRVRI